MYVGQFSDDQSHGKGNLKYGAGDRYWGDFVAGKWHGRGTLVAKDGATYVGDWVQSKQHGVGTMTWPGTGKQFTGQWIDGKPTDRGKWSTVTPGASPLSDSSVSELFGDAKHRDEL